MADKYNITDALIFLGDLVVCACHTAVADPGFQTGGANPIMKEGAPTYILPKKSMTERVARLLRVSSPFNAPLHSADPFMQPPP